MSVSRVLIRRLSSAALALYWRVGGAAKALKRCFAVRSRMRARVVSFELWFSWWLYLFASALLYFGFVGLDIGG